MPVRDTTLSDVLIFNGSVLNVTGTLVVSSFTEIPDPNLTFDDRDEDRVFDPTEAATINGETVVRTAAGTVTAGVRFGGLLTVNLGSSVLVNVIETDDTSFVQYPAGDQAALLDSLVSEVLSTPGIGTVLSILGITDVVAFVEQNALLTFDLDGNIAIPVCFAEGTRILTWRGEVAIERLRVGDTVITRDNGFQKVRWIGSKRVQAAGKFAPIEFAIGAMGNPRPLVLSPEHRLLVLDCMVELVTGYREALVAAKQFVNGETIVRREGCEITYYHIMMDRHEIVYADQVLCETLHPGRMAVRALDAEAIAEIIAIFPELADQDAKPRRTARAVLNRREALLVTEGLVERLSKHRELA